MLVPGTKKGTNDSSPKASPGTNRGISFVSPNSSPGTNKPHFLVL